MDDRLTDPDYAPGGIAPGKAVTLKRGGWVVRVPLCEDCERRAADGTYDGRLLCTVCHAERCAFERSRI